MDIVVAVSRGKSRISTVTRMSGWEGTDARLSLSYFPYDTGRR